jgi:predicted metal-binding membrane protein
VPDAAGVLYRRWGAHGPWRDALSVGGAYGRSCAGRCWALVPVAFAVGMATLGWMLTLAPMTTAEKSGLAGPSLVRSTGAALVAGGLAVAVG